MVEYLDETIRFRNLILRRIREGVTKYWVPDPHIYSSPGRYAPADLPVFYNPLMEINRDLSLLAIATYSELFDVPLEYLCYVEALAGSGIRGFRALNELGGLDVVVNDINPTCIKLIYFNSRFFPSDIRSRVIIFNYDANYLLSSLRFLNRQIDIIDIDPFGSPAPFIDSALRAIKKKNGLLLVTATDTAPLIGKFENSSLRKYGVMLQMSNFCNEIGVRALIYYIHRVATKYRIGLKPIFGFFLRNFIKVGFLSIPGRKTADAFWRMVGWIAIEDDFEFEILPLKSPKRGKKSLIGPLWIGAIYDMEFIKIATKKALVLPFDKSSKRELAKWLPSIISTINIPFYYNLEKIASLLRKPSPKVESVIKVLRQHGFIAERTHFDHKAIKTNAPYEKIVEILKEF